MESTHAGCDSRLFQASVTSHTGTMLLPTDWPNCLMSHVVFESTDAIRLDCTLELAELLTAVHT